MLKMSSVKGYEDGMSSECERTIDAYHDGYRHGYRDSRKDRYGFGWYNGLMIGTIGTIICGWVLHVTGNQSKTLDVSFGKR